MIFDFKANRYIAILGMLGLGATLFGVMSVVNNPLIILIITFIYVFMLGRLMKHVAILGYRSIHQRLFVYADAKGYLEAIIELYNRTPRRKDIDGIKLQNLIMAYIFAGDFEHARVYLAQFKDEYPTQLENNQQVQFSYGLLETLISLFDFDKETLIANYEKIDGLLNEMPPQQVAHVRENPYSVFYMITELKKLISEQKKVTASKVESLMKKDNPFLNASILYVVITHGFVEASELSFYQPEMLNTMFFATRTEKETVEISE